MSRTKLIEPGVVKNRGEEDNSPKKRSRHDVEATETVPRASSSRRSAPAIRVAGGGISSTQNDARPSAPPRTLQRSLSQPAYALQARVPPGRPTWNTTRSAAQFQVVHPASQHPHSQKLPTRQPLAHVESTQAPLRPDFTKFAYSVPSDPSQAPLGRRLTLPPATSRSTSARPSFTAQGADYRNVEQPVDPSQRPSQLELGLSQIVEQSRAKLDSADIAEGSKAKKRKKKKDNGPKKVDLSVPETGSWVRGVWVPDDPDTQDPTQDLPSNQLQDGQHGDISKGRPTDDSAPRNPLSNPNPSAGNLSFDFDRSIEIRGRPESQLPPGRQPQREVSSSTTNRRHLSAQPHPSYAAHEAQPSAYSDRRETLFLPYDSQDEPSPSNRTRRYRDQSEVQVDGAGYAPGPIADVPSRRAPTRVPDDIDYASRQETPPVLPPPKTTRSSRSEKTYSTRLPTAFTHRPRGADEDQDEDGLDDGISYNQDLIRRRRRTIVDPTPSTQPRPRNTPHDSDDPFGLAPEPSIRRRVDQPDAGSSARSAREEQFQDDQDVEGEEEVDEFMGQTYEAVGYLPVHDDYQANTPTPTPGQRLQTLPGHQHQVGRVFDTPTTSHPSSFDSTRMLPLTERLALDPNRRYAYYPTQSPGPDGHTSHRRRSHSSRKHRDQRSPRRHGKHYHDRPYKSDHYHRHHRSHDHRHQGYSDDSDDISPHGRLQMSRHESAGLHIDKYVENSRRHHSDPTRSRSPLVLRSQAQSAPRRKPDPKTRAAQRVSRRLNMSPIKIVTGEDARKVMLERSNLDSHPISKHLLGAASKDRQRARLEGLTGIKRKIRSDKENTVPRSAPARYTFQRPSSVTGDDGELVQATQSTIGEFPTQGSVTEIRRPTVVRTHRPKIPQLKFTRRSSPESPPRAAPGPVQQAGPSRIEPEHQAPAPHVPPQQPVTPLRPATPLNDIIPPLTRLPVDAGQASQTPKTPQRPAEAPKTSKSVKSARDQARARRDAADQAMVDAMLTPAEAEKLAREISPEKEAPAVEAAQRAQEAIEDFEMAEGEKSPTDRVPSKLLGAPTPPSRAVPITPSKPPTITSPTAEHSRSLGKTMTREAISDNGQGLREFLKEFQSATSSRQSSGSGPGSSKGKHERTRRKKSTATPNSGQYQRQAKLPSFMQRILPDGPPIPTQAEIRPTQVAKKGPEEEFEVKLKETRPLLIADLPSSNKKRLGKHLLEDLPGSGPGSGGDGPSHDGQNASQKSKTGSLRLGLSMPGKQNTQSKMVNSLGSQFGKTQLSQAVIRPYKDPTTSKTPRMVQADREKALTPTQRSLGPSCPVDMDEYEECEEEYELIDDDDDDCTSAPFVHPLHKTTTPRLQRSLAEAPLKNRGGSSTIPKTGPASGSVPPRPIKRMDSLKKTTPATQETNSLGLSGARDILTEDPDGMISDDDDDEEDYGDGHDEIEPSTGLDHHLRLSGPSSKTGREGKMQGTSWK